MSKSRGNTSHAGHPRAAPQDGDDHGHRRRAPAAATPATPSTANVCILHSSSALNRCRDLAGSGGRGPAASRSSDARGGDRRPLRPDAERRDELAAQPHLVDDVLADGRGVPASRLGRPSTWHVRLRAGVSTARARLVLAPPLRDRGLRRCPSKRSASPPEPCQPGSTATSRAGIGLRLSDLAEGVGQALSVLRPPPPRKGCSPPRSSPITAVWTRDVAFASLGSTSPPTLSWSGRWRAAWWGWLNSKRRPGSCPTLVARRGYWTSTRQAAPTHLLFVVAASQHLNAHPDDRSSAA